MKEVQSKLGNSDIEGEFSMTKEEILKQAQAEGRASADERDKAIQDRAFAISMLVGMMLCFLLMCVKLFCHQPYQDVYAVICSICCAQYIYNWTRYKTKNFLVYALIWGFVTTVMMVAYLMQIL